MTESFVIRPRGQNPAVALTTAPLAVDPAFGPLAVHCADDEVTDIFVNGAAGLFVDRGHGAEPVPDWAASEREVRDLAVALVGLGGRHLDDQAPCVDVRLESGIRVHAVLSPVSTSGTALSIRIPRVRAADLEALAALGAFDARQQAWLLQLVAERANILITGGTGTGNTATPPTFLKLEKAFDQVYLSVCNWVIVDDTCAAGEWLRAAGSTGCRVLSGVRVGSKMRSATPWTHRVQSSMQRQPCRHPDRRTTRRRVRP